ncbi:hypothetical protein [Autumnicola musiva]|uniref:Lipoprotein n=1 Tax=Autumnicola musiva TaxID=3075589 RepID=A0ABU3D0Z8_9FLAO|nr:hypothetical protein [Zunongwangia sp. F117]MDT0675182.1 hypothetical protein [Zunongwangia sp. F117]
MKKLLFIFFIAGLYSCNSTKKATSGTPDKFVAENLMNYSKSEISREYPDANIKEGDEVYDEGTKRRSYTILYPETTNELVITWKNGKSEIHDIRFADAGNWKTSSGIKVGTTYDELNRLNGKPVSFYGFGWDYSGAVVWNGGKLEDSNLHVFLGPEDEPADKFYGDEIIKASPREIENMNLKVQAVVLNQS